jgi:hypothetical protein
MATAQYKNGGLKFSPAMSQESVQARLFARLAPRQPSATEPKRPRRDHKFSSPRESQPADSAICRVLEEESQWAPYRQLISVNSASTESWYLAARPWAQAMSRIRQADHDILINWLIYITWELHFDQSTLFLAVHLFGRVVPLCSIH